MFLLLLLLIFVPSHVLLASDHGGNIQVHIPLFLSAAGRVGLRSSGRGGRYGIGCHDVWAVVYEFTGNTPSVFRVALSGVVNNWTE